MDERVIQFRVGVMVLAALIITAILVLLFGELPAMVRGTYTVYMHFPEAHDVSADSPVRKSGILIGRVTSVEFAEGGGVLVTAKIRDEITLRRRDELIGAEATVLVDQPGEARSTREAPEIDGVIEVPDHLAVGQFHQVRIVDALGPDLVADVR